MLDKDHFNKVTCVQFGFVSKKIFDRMVDLFKQVKQY